MAPASLAGRTTSDLEQHPAQKQPKSQRGCASVTDRPARAMRGATRARKTQLTATNLDAVFNAVAENHVTKNSSFSVARRNCDSVPLQGKAEIVSGLSTPQRTLTPQSSCTDLESASSHESSFREVEPEMERQALPSWLQPVHTKTTGGGGARASLRQRGQQIATATLGTHQDNLTRANLRARGNAVLAGVRADTRSDNATAVFGPLERKRGVATVRHSNDWSHLRQPQTLASCTQSAWHPDLAEQSPMKVDLTSLALSCIALPPGLAPPPGLARPSTMSFFAQSAQQCT